METTNLTQQFTPIKTFNLILISIASFGIFYFVYLWRLNPELERKLKRRVPSSKIILATIICFGLAGFFDSLAIELASSFEIHAAKIVSMLSLFANIATLVLNIIWSWNARNAIEQYATEKNISFDMSKIMTVLFGVYYINYLFAVLIDKDTQ